MVQEALCSFPNTTSKVTISMQKEANLFRYQGKETTMERCHYTTSRMIENLKTDNTHKTLMRIWVKRNSQREYKLV
jgi:hypothetical protein